ncbi:hypothetical protein LCGC14_1913750 [marine sediment metagenome]|uniref:Uncharacterized protein n=1 Tax=marine sediment metagenome TaxID=412755 RepID=A0A0F9IQV6_9ZZZZ
MRFITSCVNSTAELINEMIDGAIEVEWATFRKRVGIEEIRRVFPYYSYRGETHNKDGELTFPMHIKDDWGVTFWRSNYNGERCYYLEHSAIEYIFQR